MIPGRHRHGGGEPDPDEQLDLAQVRADDLLLDQLSRRSPADLFAPADPADPATEDAVEALLASWRAELQPDALPATPSLGRADWALRRGRRRGLRPMVAAAAAIAVLLLGSAGIGSRMARPGDPLWGLTQLLWSDRVDSANAEHNAQVALTAAQKELDQGRLTQASTALTAVSAQLPKVQTRDHLEQIRSTYESLVSQVSARWGESGATGDSGSSTTAAPSAPTPGRATPGTTAATSSAAPATTGASSSTRSRSATAVPPRTTAPATAGRPPTTPAGSTSSGPVVATGSPTSSAPPTTTADTTPPATDPSSPPPAPTTTDPATTSDAPTTTSTDSTTEQPNLDVTSSPAASATDTGATVPPAVPTTLPTDTTGSTDPGLSAEGQTVTPTSS